jgi:hypothetical protein
MVKNPVGRSGGLAIFWKREINFKVIGFMSKYHIDTEITEADGFVWRFTGIYGDPHEKENTWRLLRTLKHQSDKPWLCAGDFNEILYAWEKEGEPRGRKNVWKDLRRRWKYVNWTIWVL